MTAVQVHIAGEARRPGSKTKISVPGLPDHVIRRPRLTERLDGGVRGPLTVVTGPPGAGKTVAVAQWARGGDPPGPVAWVSPDRADHSPECFWTLVLAALDGAGAAGVPDRLTGSALMELGMALGGRPDPIVLVVDGFEPPPGCPLAAQLAELLSEAGPNLRLVLLSRSESVFPLHGYRLRGELTGLRWDMLAFTPRETAELLDRHGVPLDPASVRELHRRTEGWAAGLRLAALEMQGHAEPVRAAERFTGADEAVLGYLGEEVWEPLPAEMRRMMLVLSVADTFDHRLAAQLFGSRAAELFPEFLRANPFVLPAGDGGHRFHRMFRQAAEHLLVRAEPGEPRRLHRRVATWYGARGRLADAVRHAALAEDWRLAGWLVIDGLAVGQLVGLRADDTLGGLLAEFPGRAEDGEPETAIVAAALALSRGDDAGCTARLAAAEALLQSSTPGQSQRARLAIGTIHMCRRLPDDLGTLRTRISDLEGAFGRLPDSAVERVPEVGALIAYGNGIAELWSGRPDDAVKSLQNALSAAPLGGDLHRRRCLGGLAVAKALLGRFRRAAEAVTKAAQLPEVSSSPQGRRIASVHLACAWVALEHYRTEEAGRELEKTWLALRESPNDLIASLSGLVAARLELVSGSADQALRTLASTTADGMPWLDRLIRLTVSDAHAAAGTADAAVEAALSAGGSGAPDASVALARACLSKGDRTAAARLLRPALVESAATPSNIRVNAWLLDSRLAYQASDASRGRRSLDRALRLAERDSLLLPFATARSWLIPVLRRDPELLAPHRRLLEPLLADQGPMEPAPPPAVGRLSARELDVLRHLAGMLTTEEIASEMYVSVNTVKTHLKSIYRKLAVTRRGEAVRRARSLRLL
ncbi:LuxR C-terminal-related transcriptional regulator [Actinocorallia longicatena]|uniref:LuxR family transcriptional regulator n=1 Tax=Actinocorallia longicatena TaxID=111803 RepID=A0ABP6Q923_9ACTN